MKLSYDILIYILSHRYSIGFAETVQTNRVLERVVIWDGVGNRENTLYLCLPDISMPTKREAEQVKGVLLTIAEETGMNPEIKGCYIRVPAGEIWHTVNGIIDQVSRFFQWIDRLNSVDVSEDGMQQYLDIATEIIYADLSIVDRKFCKVAVYNAYPDSLHLELFSEPGQMDMDRIQRLNMDYPDMEKDYAKKGIIRNPVYSELDPQAIYFFNIHFQRELHLRLMINIKREENCAALQKLLQYAGELLEEKYEVFYQAHLADQYQDELYQSLRSLLLGEAVDKTVLNNSLKMIGWLPEHQYKIIHLKHISNYNSRYNLNYYAARFEDAFRDCRAVPLTNDLYCFYNESMSVRTRENSGDFAAFLRESMCLAGISNLFRGIETAYVHRLQADEALLYGMQNDPQIWTHEFPDISLHHLLRKCTEDYDAPEVCHPAIQTLLNYDSRHPGTDLTETLKQYIYHQYNASETADYLHVHRTTFLYRMKRIQELTNLKLETPAEMLHLMLSFALLSGV